MTPYDIAIIPCTSGKNANGMTARTLYKGSGFSLMMRHAAQRCERIYIMSAKYGLLAPDSPVAYYDTYLPDLTENERKALIWRIKSCPPAAILYSEKMAARVLSYLPKAYHDLLMEADVVRGRYARPYHNCGMLKLAQVLSNEIASYGQNPSRR